MTQTNTTQNKEELEAKQEMEMFLKYLPQATTVQLWGNPTEEVESGNIGRFDVKVISKSISQAHQSGIEEAIEVIQMTPETFEVENDGEMISVRKGVYDFKEEIIKSLKGKMKNKKSILWRAKKGKK